LYFLSQQINDNAQLCKPYSTKFYFSLVIQIYRLIKLDDSFILWEENMGNGLKWKVKYKVCKMTTQKCVS